VPFAHAVLTATPGIPFVWHFKEGPFICLEKGSWTQLLDLYRRADGQIYSSAEMRDWFDSVSPGLSAARPSLVLDGDLPKREWFEAPRAPLLSESDGEPHTVVAGRPIGLPPHTVAELAAQSIHLHFYGDFTHGQWRDWIAKAQGLAPRYLHLHANVAQNRWVDEFSRYDAGWLHCFTSRNAGDIRRADWDDLNLPARIATLAMAGVPTIQRDNGGAIVAAQSTVRALDIGLFHREIEELGAQLRARARMARLREQVWGQRMQFCFDRHAPALLAFFRAVIEGARHAKRR